jgi:O-methyltransferase domain/Dimerisation domain
MPIAGETPTRSELHRLIDGYQVSQALHVLTVLGIPDRLADGPCSSQDLAVAVGATDGPLYRLLRAVAAIGILEELPQRRFALTELGDGLRSDVPGSLAGWAAFVGREYYWAAWSRLIDGVRTGGHAFRLEHGTDPWSYRQTHPEEIPIFHRAMNSVSGQVADSLASAYDFSRFRTIVDVGGGGGALIAAILGRHPGVRAVLFDLPQMVADARPFIEQAGFAARCELVGGSFFDCVPSGGDAYLLKSVLHDWYDADVKRILDVCHAAMRPNAVLLVIERLLAPPNEGAAGKFSDLNMLVAAGGCERTADEWEAVLHAGGFSRRGITLVPGSAVIEAARI